MATIPNLLQENDDEIRNKTVSDRINNVKEADLHANIINSLQSDLEETDPNEASFVKGKSSIQGVIKYQTLVLTNWSFGNNYSVNLNTSYNFLFEKIYGVINEQVVFTGVTYNINDRVGVNYSNEAGNGDIGGVQTRITSTQFNILPKNLLLADSSGGFQTISNSNATGKIYIVCEFYGTPI